MQHITCSLTVSYSINESLNDTRSRCPT